MMMMMMMMMTMHRQGRTICSSQTSWNPNPMVSNLSDA